MFMCTHKNGFTLIELMVAMVISSIVMAAIYATYNAQLKSHVTQQKVVEMHQNARAAMFMLEREIRLAGYDPLDSDELDYPRITTAQIDEIIFTMDTTGGEADLLDNDDDNIIDEPGETDGDTDDDFEKIRYFLSNDANDDGIADSLNCNLQRQYWEGGAWQPNLETDPDATIAIDIDALNFVYLDADGNDLIDYSGALTPPQVPAADLDDIRSVQITIVARAGQNERQGLPGNALDTKVYMNHQDRPGDDWDIILPAPNDKFRRIVLTEDVKCRNLGL
jgi:type IV pilus assembly protein PilW